MLLTSSTLRDLGGGYTPTVSSTPMRDINEQEVTRFQNLLDFLKRLSDDGVTPLIEKQTIQMLDNSLPFFAHAHLVLTDVFPEIHRLTVNKRVLGSNKRIKDISFLKYPPKDKVKKYGRCNLPGQSVLYSSIMNMTTLSELKPRVGDLVTHSVWRVRNDQSLTYCPIFKNQPPDNDIMNLRTYKINQLYKNQIKSLPSNLKRQVDNLTQFIADAFTKRVHPERPLDYVFSAYFSNKILYDFENGRIEAIYYPSVQDQLSFENLAIKPEVFEDKYQLIEVKDSLVIVDPSNGMRAYSMEGLSDCKNFDYAKGQILWSDRVYQPEFRVRQIKDQFGVDLT